MVEILEQTEHARLLAMISLCCSFFLLNETRIEIQIQTGGWFIYTDRVIRQFILSVKKNTYLCTFFR